MNKKKNAQSAAAAAAANVRAAMAACKASLVNRDGEVNAIFLALAQGEHVVMVGPPGVAKSMAARAACTACGGRMFSALLSRHSTIDDLLGPVDLPALMNGALQRNAAGRLADAEVAFLDEVFNASPSLLQALLGAMNERHVDLGGGLTSIPLVTVVAASNQWPDGRPELEAFADRFLYRRQVRRLSAGGLRELVTGCQRPEVQPGQLLDDLATLRAAASDVVVSGQTADQFFQIIEKLSTRPSDRRVLRAMQAVKVAAALAGRDEATADDMAVLADILWVNPGDAAAVAAAVMAVAAPAELVAERLLVEAEEAEAGVRDFASAKSANGKLIEIAGKMAGLVNRLPNAAALAASIKARAKAVRARALATI